ncbi:mechanosensitive ion channel family protein [Sphingobacterium sp. MYb382]|uniref:mechanosensitive ion channel family protein n=1 Tax=Sphingobacterium sp. MYb382 TaxID=2745278 RepID=UPI0030B63DC2
MEKNLTHLEGTLEKLINMVVMKLPSIAVGLVILLVGIYFIRFFIGVLAKRFERRHVSLSIRSFMESLVRIVLYILLFLTVANTIGIPTTSFIAILSAFGLAVGLALQGSLSNFAGGVLILLFRPFEVGDEIESANGSSGTVNNIDLLYTTLNDGTGVKVFSPNGSLANSVIRNFSKHGNRRMQFTVHVTYDTNIKEVRDEVLALFQQEEKILDKPEPICVVGDLTDSGVQLIINAWTASKLFGATRYEMAEKLKLIFEKRKVAFAKTSIKVITVD